ncbi:hypothetical protein EG329_012074 [Mollisiaceae sp. DMI_Dod_QoI]|nr:hypothetical protein EG329_012074 [Helotiales sp. DMI_Dod_QoI]
MVSRLNSLFFSTRRNIGQILGPHFITPNSTLVSTIVLENMSSAINTPAGRKRLHDGAEYDYVPRTPGTIFPMDLDPSTAYGAMYFEPPRRSMQSSLRVDDFGARDSTSWPMDSLQHPPIHDSYFGNMALFQNGFEAPETNYTFLHPVSNTDIISGDSQGSLHSQLGRNQHMDMNNIGRDPWPRRTFEQPYPPVSRNVSDWVANSVDPSRLPPEITIDSPFGYIPPPSHFPDPRTMPEPESALAERAIGSEANFQTPSSSLSTSDGTFDYSSRGGCVDLPHRHQIGSLSTNASSFNGNSAGAISQWSVYTPQSSSLEDWPAGLQDQSGISRSKEKIHSDEVDVHDTPSQFTGPIPPTYSDRPRRMPVILPAPPKQQVATASEGNIQGNLDVTRSTRTCDRRVLSVKGRKEAEAVRKVGACLICRYLNKTKCSSVPGTPCASCERLLGRREQLLETKDLATGICIRIDLQHYRNEIDDLYDVKFRKYNIPIKPYESRRTIVIGHSIKSGGVKCAYFPMDTTLSVDVQDCEFIGHGFGRKTKWEEHSERMSSYRIEERTLPTPDKLDAWGRNLMAEFSRQLPDFEPPIRDKFLFEYCNITPHLPFHNLVDLTIRMMSLSLWLHGTHPAISPPDLKLHGNPLLKMSDGSIEQMLSPIARGQLRSIAAKGIEETEKELLKSFDYTIKRPPEDAIIIGLSCIDRRREKQKVMYEAMTTGYSLLYRKSASPYSPDWRIELHLDSFGEDKNLARIFMQLKDADKRFYEENVNDDDDVHARKLFWERMVKSQKKTRGDA